jgi:ribosomal protein L7/L12
MDMRFLVASLSDEEVSTLNTLIWKRLEQISKDKVKDKSLSIDEILLINKGQYINAIKAVRLRLECGLREAKHMVDVYMEQSQGKG